MDTEKYKRIFMKMKSNLNSFVKSLNAYRLTIFSGT